MDKEKVVLVRMMKIHPHVGYFPSGTNFDEILTNLDTSRGQTAFSYKKWDLQYQEGISDIISLGQCTNDIDDYG
jgi:hypothetical protein